MLTIMSFNIQNKYVLDCFSKFFNSRMTKILKIIEKENPDIIGLQEVTPKIKKILEERLPQYNIIGRSRYNDQSMADEYNLIMASKKHRIVTSGTYSLGPDINKVGSRGLLDVFPRICSYTKIEHQGKIIAIFNTHLDHLLNYNRCKQLKQIKNIINLQGTGCNIIMGDFNLTRESEMLKEFMDEDYKNVADDLEQPTFRNLFIDQILFTDEISLLRAYVNDSQDLEKYPSDHFPIVAKINLR